MKFRLVSFNIRNEPSERFERRRSRNRAISRFLAAMKADLLCLQEVVPETYAELKDALRPDFSTFCPREDGLRQGEGVPILLCNPRFRVDRNERFWLSETPENPSLGWTARCHRIVSAVRIREDDQRAFWLLNIHLDHRSRKARANSLVLLRRKLDTFMSGPEEEVVFCGDFNMRPADPLFPPFLAGRPALQSAAEGFPTGATFHGWGPLRLGRAALDHCFSSPGFRVKDYRVVEALENSRRISDHNAIQVDFEDSGQPT